ncbi:MAG: LysE family transporter [Rhodobacteraceae bacterium]|nr:LysE family transporter [Paracoccaceae bacterium]
MNVPVEHFLTVWAVLAMNIASPGPNVLNTMTTAMGSGRAAGMASAAGVALGVGAWCLAMTLGMAALFDAVPWSRTALTITAIGLLLWFASRFLRNAWTGYHSGPTTRLKGRAGIGLRASFLRSLAVNATNPKALTTWVLILALFPVARASRGDIAILGLGAAFIGFSLHALYALAFSTGPATRAYLRAAPAINAGVAVFFIGFAVKLTAGLLPG